MPWGHMPFDEEQSRNFYKNTVWYLYFMLSCLYFGWIAGPNKGTTVFLTPRILDEIPSCNYYVLC